MNDGPCSVLHTIVDEAILEHHEPPMTNTDTEHTRATTNLSMYSMHSLYFIQSRQRNPKPDGSGGPAVRRLNLLAGAALVEQNSELQTGVFSWRREPYIRATMRN